MQRIEYKPGWKRDDGIRFSIDSGTFKNTKWGEVWLAVGTGCNLMVRLPDGRGYHLDPEDAFCLLMPVIEAEDARGT